MGSDQWESTLQQCSVCSSRRHSTLYDPTTAPVTLVQSRSEMLQSSLAHRRAQPAWSCASFCLSELEGMTSESRRLKHMITERFPLLSSPVVLLCSGEKMKGWKITRGKIWTFSCWVATHFVEKYCQMLFVVVFHLQSHSFSEGFSFDWLKSIDGKVTWFPAEPSAALFSCGLGKAELLTLSGAGEELLALCCCGHTDCSTSCFIWRCNCRPYKYTGVMHSWQNQSKTLSEQLAS